MKELERLQKMLDEAARAAADLEGELTEVAFDPFDMDSVNKAIADMETAVEAKLAPYRGNEIVESLLTDSKAQLRDAILARVQTARGMQGDA